MSYFNEWDDNKLLGYIEGQKEAIAEGFPETRKYSAALNEAKLRGLYKVPVLTQSQVTALVAKAAAGGNGKEISEIQSMLVNSLQSAGHDDKVAVLLESLFVEAWRNKTLIGLIPFFVAVCTKADNQIFGEIDWDTIGLTDTE